VRCRVGSAARTETQILTQKGASTKVQILTQKALVGKRDMSSRAAGAQLVLGSWSLSRFKILVCESASV
jgi:hypothetical protein